MNRTVRCVVVMTALAAAMVGAGAAAEEGLPVNEDTGVVRGVVVGENDG